MTNDQTHPRRDPRELALELAHDPNDAPGQVVERAEAYLKFLSDEKPA